MNSYELFHQQMAQAYKEQQPKPSIELSVDYEDWQAFTKICRRYNMTVSHCFHYLVKTHG